MESTQCINEILLGIQIAQMRDKLALYESLIGEITKLDSIEKSVSEVKEKLERVAEIWSGQLIEQGDGG